jgi:hypothetical protein
MHPTAGETESASMQLDSSTCKVGVVVEINSSERVLPICKTPRRHGPDSPARFRRIEDM